jgi:hypothetical protein
MQASRWWKAAKCVSLVAGFGAGSLFCSAYDEHAAAAPGPLTANSGLYIKVQMARPVKMTKLLPGDVVEGSLERDVYSGDRELFTAGSHVRLTVDHLDRRRRVPNDHWPWVIKVFTPRHEKYPAFKTGTVSGPNGETPLQVSLISESYLRGVHAQAKKNPPVQSANEPAPVEVSKSNQPKEPKKEIAPTLVLEASGLDNQSSTPPAPVPSDDNAPRRAETLPTGTQCKILLLTDVSASKSRPGDVLQARLLEPVLLNSHVVLPAGTVVEGKVVKQVAPRMLSRAGSLYLTFTNMTLPGGNRIPITASLATAELDRRSHTRIDSEGGLRGERPGKAWMAINLAVTAGVAKEADDGFQLIAEAIVSTATDISTAGSARIIASCSSAIFLATRHGRDVVLPRFTEMDISLDRPLSLEGSPESGTSAGSR